MAVDISVTDDLLTFVTLCAQLTRDLLEVAKFLVHLHFGCCNFARVQKDCPTGQLTRRKFLTIYRNMFPGSRAVAFYEHVFRTLDQDGSGTIDFKEFLQVNVQLLFIARQHTDARY